MDLPTGQKWVTLHQGRVPLLEQQTWRDSLEKVGDREGLQARVCREEPGTGRMVNGLFLSVARA